MYQLDLANDVKNILANEAGNVFIQEKEIKRIGVANSSLSDRQMSMSDLPLSYETLTPFYDLYDYIRNDVFFMFSRKNQKSAPQVHIPDNSHSFFREIRHYRSNNRTSYYSIYYHPHIQPDLTNHPNEAQPQSIKEIVGKGLLKAYEPLSDTYVFQVEKELIWLIGSEIPVGTEIVYHLHTDSPELLPPKRIKHGFDNLGILIRSQDDIKRIGKYIVFRKGIPDKYPITTIRVGFFSNKKDITEWSRVFPYHDCTSSASQKAIRTASDS